MKSVHELPSLLDIESDEELDARSLEHAKYFTVVQIRPGGFSRLGVSNYLRREAPNFAVALDMAQSAYKATGKPCLIYAVVDFAGARNFTRHITNIPPVGPVTRRERDARDELLKKQKLRAMQVQESST